MKPSRRTVVWLLAFLTSAVVGVGCDRGSQTIITIRRGSTFPTSPKPGQTVKPTAPQEIAPSNGVDVPIIQVP